MGSPIFRDATSAWDALCAAKRLDLDERDDDLVGKLREQLDPLAPDLASALTGASTDEFLAALFNVVQPFVAMFRDILTFFRNAGAKRGQSQWRISVGDTFLELRHFEEFLETWKALDAEIEVPVLDRANAFFLNSARLETGGWDYLREGLDHGQVATTGIADVDDWLEALERGEYRPFPASLMPDRFPSGLREAASVLLAAVTILRRRGLSRDAMLAEHAARRYRSVESDALHPWTIAQSETDHWLRSHVVYLATILQRPHDEIGRLAKHVEAMLEPFPRRQVPGTVGMKEFERLLSLPVWRRRYETYGVWIATVIAGALGDHDLAFRPDGDALTFSFNEARILDVLTTRPMASLFAERRVALDDPQGKGRTKSVQPDFSIWKGDRPSSDCILVVEVKHYKKRSRRNFEDALSDYARAHPRAKVILVNYGPVGKEFDGLPGWIAARTTMMGPLTPETGATLEDFRALVSEAVGPPVRVTTGASSRVTGAVVVIDVSGSMREILSSEAFWSLLDDFAAGSARLIMIDDAFRAELVAGQVAGWLAANRLGETTSLARPLSELLAEFGEVTLLTDQSGFDSLGAFHTERLQEFAAGLGTGILVRVKS